MELKWAGGAGCQPRRGQYAGDAGIDMVVAENVKIWPQTFKDVSLGCAVKLPYGTWGMLVGRSSTLRRLGLLVNTGIIDGGYTGPMFVGVYNTRDTPIELVEGQRICQLLLMQLFQPVDITRVEADELPQTDRGDGGFGSTGW